MRKFDATKDTGPRFSFPTGSHDEAISPLLGLVLGALVSAIAIPIATSWSVPWMIFGVVVGGLVGGALGYWTSRPQH